MEWEEEMLIDDNEVSKDELLMFGCERRVRRLFTWKNRKSNCRGVYTTRYDHEYTKEITYEKIAVQVLLILVV